MTQVEAFDSRRTTIQYKRKRENAVNNNGEITQNFSNFSAVELYQQRNKTKSIKKAQNPYETTELLQLSVKALVCQGIQSDFILRLQQIFNMC